MCIPVALVAGLPLTWLYLRLAAALMSAPGAWRRRRVMLRYLLIAALLAVTLPALGVNCASPATPQATVRLLLAAILALIIVIDLEHRRIPHAIQLPAMALAAFLAADAGHLPRAASGGMAGFLLGGLMYAGGELYRRANLRLRGMHLRSAPFGAGDVLLTGLCGLVAGWPLILPAILAAIVSAGVVALLLLCSGLAARQSPLPYAPFLLGGTLLVLRFPQPAVRFLASFG